MAIPMNTCADCKSNLPDEAKYCPACGSPVANSDRLSDFNLGKLAALIAIKEETLAWLRNWGVGIGVATAILAYFGMNELVKSTVSERVQSELRNNREDIRKSLENVFIDVGKANRNQQE